MHWSTSIDPGYKTNVSFFFRSTIQKFLKIRQYLSILSRHRQVISCIGNNRTWSMTKLDSNFKSNISWMCETVEKLLIWNKENFPFWFCLLYTRKHTHTRVTHAQNTWFQLNMYMIYLLIYFSISIFSQYGFIVLIVQILYISC